MGDTTKDRIDEILDQGVRLPPLSAGGAELLALAQKPTDEINVSRIVELTETDPALIARLLRIANSPLYGFSRTITGLRQAVTLIGVDETLSVVNFHLLSHALPLDVAFEQFSGDRFWIHSWACATAARALSQRQYAPHSFPGQSYLAGLLHDIGKIVLATSVRDDFQKCLEKAYEEQIPLFKAEWAVLGFDHAALGARLLDNWHMPEPVLHAIAGHHSGAIADSIEEETIAVTAFANYIAGEAGFGESGTPIREESFEGPLFREGRALASPEDRENAIEVVVESVRQSARLLTAGETGADGDEESQSLTIASPDAPKPSPKPGDAKPGLWASIIRGIRNILND